MKKNLLAIVFIVAVAALIYTLWPKEVHTNLMQTVTVGNTVFKVEVVDTDAARELGLGQRTSLPQGQGMLFKFDYPSSWGFWMKDTEFALDMLWVREDGTITTIARDVDPATYPKVFYPKTPDAKYVLEINAGAAAGIAEGQKLMVQ